MRTPVVIIGIGELGSVFARGMLRTAHPVYPLLRGMDPAEEARQMPQPQAVIVATGEADLHPVLERVPGAWKDRLVLLQNELLPRDWEAHHIAQPTVIAVWFEKKKGMDVKVLLPSPVWGPHAALIVEALAAIDIPAREVATAEAMTLELVAKNLYILTTNICGLVLPEGATAGELHAHHAELERAVATEVLDVQEWRAGHPLDRPLLLRKLEEAIAADPAHRCKGRSAPARLLRALEHARAAGLAVPTLRDIARRAGLAQENSSS